MLIHMAHQEVAHSSIYRILGGPDPQTKTNGEKPGRSAEDAGNKKVKKNIICDREKRNGFVNQ